MRRRRKRDIVIELTALLDVIMIMIFMVMNENSKLVSEAQSKLGAVQQENIEQAGKISELSAELTEALAMLDEGNLDELFQRLESAESKLEAYQALDDEIIILNVALSNNSNNSIRYLSYGKVADPNGENRIEIRNDTDRSRAERNLRMFIANRKFYSFISRAELMVRSALVLFVNLSMEYRPSQSRSFKAGN